MQKTLILIESVSSLITAVCDHYCVSMAATLKDNISARGTDFD